MDRVGKEIGMEARWKCWKAVASMVVIAMSLGIANQVEAAIGDLDPTFGNSGKVVTDFFGGADRARAVAVQWNGRIVAVGSASDDQNRNGFALARYDNGGNLDPSFGDGGKTIMPLLDTTPSVGSNLDTANAIVIQNDGSIVVAGISTNGDTNLTDFSVLRFTNRGRIDTRFGTHGFVRTSFPGASAGANGMLLQPDGKIVVVGAVNYGFSNKDMVVVRYNSNGSLDTTFGQGGIVTIDLSSFDEAKTVHLAPGNKILVGGITLLCTAASCTNVYDFALLRLNSDGSRDTSFGNNGLVTTHFDLMDEINALDVALDGSIVAAGVADRLCSGPGCPKMALVRYDASGNLDLTFGNGGKIIFAMGSTTVATGVAITAGTPSPKIVVGGYFQQNQFCHIQTTPVPCNFMVLRYNWDGTPDTTFGNGGSVFTDIGRETVDTAFGLIIDRNGQIVLAGQSGSDFALVRYLSGDCRQSFPPPVLLPQAPVGRCN